MRYLTLVLLWMMLLIGLTVLAEPVYYAFRYEYPDIDRQYAACVAQHKCHGFSWELP